MTRGVWNKSAAAADAAWKRRLAYRLSINVCSQHMNWTDLTEPANWNSEHMLSNRTVHIARTPFRNYISRCSCMLIMHARTTNTNYYASSLSPDIDLRITNGRSNLTRGRIAAAHRSFIVFSTWRQCAPNAWFLCSHDSASQTVSESVPPFLQGSRSWPTDGHKQTERQTYHDTTRHMWQ